MLTATLRRETANARAKFRALAKAIQAGDVAAVEAWNASELADYAERIYDLQEANRRDCNTNEMVASLLIELAKVSKPAKRKK